MEADLVTIDRLATLLDGRVRGDGSVTVTDATHDSREAGPGVLFVAIRGFTSDGHRFGPLAARAGSPLLVEEWVDAVDVPQVMVADTRLAMGRAAALIHGSPSAQMAVVGITGTNGKTTVTYQIESILRAAGRRAGRIGTTGAAIDGRPVPLARTTPEATDLQRLLARMVGDGVEVAAIEVSSHALTLHRVEGIHFRVGAFTNLSQDHLDFHADMESYFEAKARLFDGRSERAVVWIDDPYGAVLAGRIGDEAVTVGFSPAATVRGIDPRPGLVSSQVVVDVDGERMAIEVRPGGDYNIANALVAAAVCKVLGIDAEAIGRGLAAVGAVPGRLEAVEAGQPFVVLVDYAHTPGGIESVVATVRAVSGGTILAVAGAGGDRDVAKRPLMGAAAASADIAIITSDNPRSEDPDAIIAQVLEGTRHSGATILTEPDRELAIAKALELAHEGDVVLILGKGHEQGQEFADHTLPFDDREVAMRHLRMRWAS